MITLNRQQRDFLDRYYIEYSQLEAKEAITLGAEHGFYYEHFLALFEIYRQAWGGSFSNWKGERPPVPDSPLIFPWDSVEDLEFQLEAEGFRLNRLPRKTVDVVAHS